MKPVSRTENIRGDSIHPRQSRALGAGRLFQSALGGATGTNMPRGSQSTDRAAGNLSGPPDVTVTGNQQIRSGSWPEQSYTEEEEYLEEGEVEDDEGEGGEEGEGEEYDEELLDEEGEEDAEEEEGDYNEEETEQEEPAATFKPLDQPKMHNSGPASKLFGAKKETTSVGPLKSSTGESIFVTKNKSAAANIFDTSSGDSTTKSASADNPFQKASTKAWATTDLVRGAAGENPFSKPREGNVFGKPESTTFAKPAAASERTADQPNRPIPFPSVSTSSGAENIFGSGKAAAEDGLFGKSTGGENVFGKPSAGASIFGNTSGDNVFTKPAATSVNIFAKAPPTESAFGEPSSKTLFAKAGTDIVASKSMSEKDSFSKSSSNIFGKSTDNPSVKENPFAARPSGVTDNPFGKPGDLNIFGKSSGANVFGKPETAKWTTPRDNKAGANPQEQSIAKDIYSTVQHPLKGHIKLPPGVSMDHLTAIVCTEVPDVLNSEYALNKHFSKFGQVVRIRIDTRRKMCKVVFTDHGAAKTAAVLGKIWDANCPPLKISITISRSAQQNDPQAKNPTAASNPFERKMTAKPAGGFVSKSDLDMELESMMGTGDVRMDNKPMAERKPKKTFNLTKALQAKQPVQSKVAASTIVTAESTGTSGKNASDLLRIMKTPALTDADRFAVLDARDKYIRMRNLPSTLRSGTDIKKMNLVGTCPDFCPEKERYSRSAKCQLRAIEKTAGQLNHLTTIKEHSRSAADQDVPLPHELRPPNILSSTLDYLMFNIVDRIDYVPSAGTLETWFNFIKSEEAHNLSHHELYLKYKMSCLHVMRESGENDGEWFEFIWSTTRAIRKDITQQNLCDSVSVTLVEKCARFHIFCAERLCEKDAHDFDNKLNNENLTKCLQSLKHMYYDLSLEGEICPNEPEFRVYDILLNLNEGDTQREIQSFSERIRNHPSVKAAVRILKAMDSNNYILFFRLVRQATYLEACILKRYFDQVRRKALEIILKAYCPKKQVMTMPMGMFLEPLGFEDDRDAGHFLRMHGIESEQDTVYLDRGSFFYPELKISPTRSMKVIESKRNDRSYGEIMNGAPLGANPYLTYKPHNSFDANGNLKPESYDAKDQVQSPEEISRIAKEKEAKRQLIKMAEKITDECVEAVVETEVDEAAHNAVEEAAIEEEELKAAEEFSQDILDEILDSMTKATAKDLITELKNDLLMERLKHEEKLEAEMLATDQIVDDMIQLEVKSISRECMLELAKEKKMIAMKAACNDVLDNIIQKLVEVEAEAAAQVVMKESQHDHLDRVNKFQLRMERKIMKKCFLTWRYVVLRRMRQRNFPATPNHALSLEEINQRLGYGPRARNRRSLRSLTSVMAARTEWRRLVELQTLEENLLNAAVLQPFNLINLLKQKLAPAEKARHFTDTEWKLLISTSDDASPEIESFVNMIKYKLKKSCSTLPCRSPPITSTPSSKGNEATGVEDLVLCRSVPVEPEGSLISVCARVVGPDQVLEARSSESQRRRIFAGTGSHLFLHLEASEDNKNALERLEAMVMNTPKIPAVPMAIISHLPIEDASKIFSPVAKYVEEGYLSDYKIFEVTPDMYNIDSITAVTNAIQYLVEHSPGSPPPGLAMKSLENYVEDFLSSHFYRNVYHNLKERRLDGLPHRNPEDLIEFYNHAVDHLKAVLSDPLLQEISWPIPEFSRQDTDIHGEMLPADWNHTARLDAFINILDSIKIHTNFQVFECNSWKNLQEQVWVKIGNLVVPGCNASVLESEIRRMLSRAHRTFISQCHQLGAGNGVVPVPELLPWTDILTACINYRIQAVLTQEAENGSCFTDGAGWVCYREHMLADMFEPPPSWSQALSWTFRKEEQSAKELIKQCIAKAEDQDSASDAGRKSKYDSPLQQLIKDEQKESLKFELMLENALSDNYEPSPETRSFKRRAPMDDVDLSESISPGGRKQARLSMGGSVANDSSLLEESLALEMNESFSESVRQQRMELVPVISYVSPSLGQLVSPHSVTCRAEVVETGMAVRNAAGAYHQRRRSGETSTERTRNLDMYSSSAKKLFSGTNHRSPPQRLSRSHSAILGVEDDRPRLRIEDKLELLKASINEDVKKSEAYERWLEDALLDQ